MNWTLLFELLFLSTLGGARQPNILIILADDLGYNDIGYHNPKLFTPTLDRLAREGVTLEQSYMQPVCTPSRSALLTGIYPFKIGRQAGILGQTQPTGLTLDKAIMPEFFKRHGYTTHAIGKWHLGYCKEAFLPTNRGFDSHYGYWGGEETYSTHINAKRGAEGYDFRYNLETDLEANNSYSIDLFEQQMAQIIQENKENPFLIYLASQAPHSPLEAPQRFVDLYPDIEDPTRQMFSAVVSALDESIGRIVQMLQSADIYEDTILLFMGDNGGIHLRKGGGNNFPLRGYKGYVWEGGVRTPAFLHYPRLNKTGVVLDDLVHVTDWLPTLLNAAGVSQEELDQEGWDGVSQWEMIQSAGLTPGARREMVVNLEEEDGQTTRAALRVDNYKLLVKPGPGEWIPDPSTWGEDVHRPTWREEDPSNFWEEGPTAREENLAKQSRMDAEKMLFDISIDPEERENLAPFLPDLVDQLEARLEELRLDLVPADNPDNTDGCLEDGIWCTGWC